MTRRSFFARSLAGLGVALVLAACGGAPPRESTSPAGAPPSSPAILAEPAPEAPPQEPRTVDEAQRQIAQALDVLDGRRLQATEAAKSAPAEGKPSGKADDRDASSSAAARCASSCRALDSMKRAVTALCRLTSEADAKCVDARKTLADNVEKTTYCRCHDS